jgi:enoyl-CoA hydratase/carnithine racemase
MLEIRKHGSVGELSLNKAPVNALNLELVVQLREAVESSAEGNDALVISGKPGMFSAGLDVRELMTNSREQMTVFWQEFFLLLETVASSKVPVVAAINGHAPAGGAVLALFCDYRIMCKGSFVIGLNETAVGLLIPGVIRQALIRLVGSHRAERLIVSGTLMEPEQAYKSGLVDELADSPEMAVEAAINWCHKLLTLPSHAMLGNRSLMRQDLVKSWEQVDDNMINRAVSHWFRAETQAVMAEVIAKLTRKS